MLSPKIYKYLFLYQTKEIMKIELDNTPKATMNNFDKN